MTREERNNYIYWLTRRKVNNKIEKRCSQCQEWKEENIENFYFKNKKYPEIGYTPACRICTSLKTQIWQRNNNETYRKAIKKRDSNLSEECKQYHRDKAIEQQKTGYQIIWRKKHPDKCREYSKLHKNHDITEIEWKNNKKYFNYECAYCGLPVEKHFFTRNGITKNGDFHKDHAIDNGKDNLSNCIPSCMSCNSSKKEESLNNWYNIKNPNYTYERYYKIYMWIRYDYKTYIMPKRRYKGQRMTNRIKEIKNNKNFKRTVLNDHERRLKVCI